MEMSKEVKEILGKVSFTYHRSSNQTAHMFSEGHTKFDCKMTYGGVSYQSTYQCNVQYSDMNNIKVDFIACVFMDKMSYDCCRDEEDFAANLGMDYYEDRKEVNRCYRACQRASERIDEMFDSEELEILSEFFREY